MIALSDIHFPFVGVIITTEGVTLLGFDGNSLELTMEECKTTTKQYLLDIFKEIKL